MMKYLDEYRDPGRADFGGVVKQICLEYTPEAQVNDYVLVHVGFALSTIDQEEATRAYDLLKEMAQLQELDIPEVEEAMETVPKSGMPAKSTSS